MARVALLVVAILFCLACSHALKPYVRVESERRFWVITDIHYDDGYIVGSEADCGEPLCCRNNTNTKPSNTTIKDPAGKWGNYKCDAPMILIQTMLKEMAAVEPNPDFIVWLGDNVKHDIWEQTKEENLQATFNCTQFIKQAFPNTRVIPIFGNHEAYPTDQFAPPPGMDWLYSSLAQYWKDWLPEDALASFLYAGYYQTTTDDGLLVLALNMMYCDPLNFYLQQNSSKDPGNQLQWLEGALTQAQAIDQKVLIIAHIPPGMELKAGPPNCLPEYSSEYATIISNFSDIIIGQLYGHTHEDNFLVFRDSETFRTPVSFGLVNPSITPYVGHNPAVRLITYEDSKKEFSGVFTYWVDLNATNTQDEMVFELEYHMPSDYNMSDLSPASWESFAEKMKEDKELFDLFYLHYYTMDSNHTCGFVCRRFAICAMQNVGSFSDYSTCLL